MKTKHNKGKTTAKKLRQRNMEQRQLMDSMLPTPPPSRIFKDGEWRVCDQCGSSVHRRWWGKVDGCIQPLCGNYFMGPTRLIQFQPGMKLELLDQFAIARKGDVVFVEYPKMLTEEQRTTMREAFNHHLKDSGVKIVIFEDGMKVARIEGRK